MHLISTVVAPSFTSGTLVVHAVDHNKLADLLGQVTVNLHGHAATVDVLRTLCPTIPEAKRGFWDGTGTALAVRPRGGVRGASANGDTAVTLDDLEAVLVTWRPA